MKLISEEAPDAIKEFDGFGPLNGRKVAIDASMAMYQFLVAVRTGSGGNQQQLTNETPHEGVEARHGNDEYDRDIDPVHKRSDVVGLINLLN